tara:strand:- start:305 stop:679 length:375 start_codon:yes stop_codon:yes gene_type:complete
MIKYTINPIEYNEADAHLMVDIIPVDNPSLQVQRVVLAISSEVLQEIDAETETAAQKAIIRREILGFNPGLQGTWEREKDIKLITIPQELTDLLGVPGTTPVTEAEIAEWEVAAEAKRAALLAG